MPSLLRDLRANGSVVSPNGGILDCSVYAAEWGRAHDFVAATMRAYWSESRDIGDLSTLGREVVAAGLSLNFKVVIEQNTNKAMGREVFGAPSFLIGDRLLALSSSWR
ncbi:DsbA family protein [Caballeronia sp. KNU42]